MRRQQNGQASTEWLLLSLLIMTILFVVEEQLSLIDYLIEVGREAKEFYYFIWRYLVLIPGGGS
ncbi:hypothetical protein KF946_06540 [Idiomarina loihiensis]|jgi:hypothetical protein|uniref:hypothetical protein n=1 Tax=Idiomarina TaxID=135575 RepID=UPI0003327E75|nr:MULTISPECIES: hypothetical protein [Idiomarina]AGM35775.1 hypothetical protein K734_04550 [Idiomarina loihiensis GSL 199]MRJ43632.1 hypothetical protein [Idiomarina loihiensis]TDO53259.1 hypothetical protein DEU30_101289 [Idiomarina sp. 017G]UTW34228.1 hypothetical protein KF946_06540 [Idiomarina loihiensis]|tara:strand:+ start:49 stop:240 length:192 start_codon:yes stop_codon:yes gene_type:complete